MGTEVSLSGRRVLIAEDNFFVARGLARDFEILGIDVVGPVPSVDEALNLIATEFLDGVVLNIELRGELTHSVASALSERSIPFVFAAGHSMDAMFANYQSVPHFEKPVRGATLLTALFAG